jgi:hypothetical protein
MYLLLRPEEPELRSIAVYAIIQVHFTLGREFRT